MKKVLLSGIFLILFSLNCFAGLEKTPVFTIKLPQNMKLTWHKEDKHIPIYQSLFQNAPFNDKASQQMRITVVGKAPSNVSQYPAWELNVLGSNIALYTEAFRVDLSQQRQFLSQKPKIIKLGKYSFSSAKMKLDDTEVYFLTTVNNKSTYSVILSARDKNSQQRTLKMNQLLDAIKSVEL